MNILKLTFDDSKCVLCIHGVELQLRPLDGSQTLPLPWHLCPTHYGVLTDDPKIMEMLESVEDL